MQPGTARQRPSSRLGLLEFLLQHVRLPVATLPFFLVNSMTRGTAMCATALRMRATGTALIGALARSTGGFP